MSAQSVSQASRSEEDKQRRVSLEGLVPKVTRK